MNNFYYSIINAQQVSNISFGLLIDISKKQTTETATTKKILPKK